MADEITPTTEQVEDGFAYDPEYEYHNPTDGGYVERNRQAFRRWLAEHVRERQEKAFDAGLDTALGGHPPVVLDVVKKTNPYRKKTQ